MSALSAAMSDVQKEHEEEGEGEVEEGPPLKKAKVETDEIPTEKETKPLLGLGMRCNNSPYDSVHL